MLQRWFTSSNPITHMPWGFKLGGGDCAFHSISVLIFPQQHNMSPHSLCKVIPFSHFIVCTFTDPPVLRTSFLFVLEQKAWPETFQSPLPGCWFDLWVSIQPQLLAGDAPHILLTFSSQSPAPSSPLAPQKMLVSGSNTHFIFSKLCYSWTLLWFPFPFIFFPGFTGIFSFSEAFNSVCVLLNSCSTTLKIQPFPYRGPTRLQRLEKLLAASPTHLRKGEAPFASLRLTPRDLIQNLDSDKTPLEINGYID